MKEKYRYDEMIHSISKMYHWSYEEAGRLTELEYYKIRMYENLDVERQNYIEKERAKLQKTKK